MENEKWKIKNSMQMKNIKLRFITLIVVAFLINGCEQAELNVRSPVDIKKTTNTTQVYQSQDLSKMDSSNFVNAMKARLSNLYTQANQYSNRAIFTTDAVATQEVAFTSSNAADSSASSATSSGADSSTNFSETNVQVAGVAESDRMKRIDDNIYLLNLHNNSSTQSIIATWQIDSEATTATETNSINLDFKSENLYKHKVGENNSIVALSSSNYYFIDAWFFHSNGYNQSNATVQRLSENQGQLTTNGKVVVSGNLINSRLIGDNLYMVVNYNPRIDIPHPYPTTDSQYQSNKTAINQLTAEQLLPTVAIDGVTQSVFVSGCLLDDNTENMYQTSYALIVRVNLAGETLTADGQCYLGSAKVMYMSNNAIYLASTLYSDASFYEVGNSRFSNYVVTTEIHRFGLNSDGSVAYSNSGQVLGNVDWDESKAAFHFAEIDGHLAVVTYIEGYTRNTIATTRQAPLNYYFNYDNVSPVQLSILDVNTMDRVAQLPNATNSASIGKPNEALYSVRYIGNQLNLVTFAKIDPLYNIDLSTILQPRITGELEITGVSNYLHPVADNYILGIGRDAVPAESNERGDANFAWFQGVQISLFARASDGALSLVDKVIVGKRGTMTPAENNHHSFSYLANAETFTFAIPVAVHETLDSNRFQSAIEVARYYSWTRTELQIYEINTASSSPTITLFDSILGKAATTNDRYDYPYDNRSILSTNGAFYIYRDTILTQNFED